MVYYNASMLPELRNLPLFEREKLMQDLHWAISEHHQKMITTLENFRDGEELHISGYDLSEVYEGMTI